MTVHRRFKIRSFSYIHFEAGIIYGITILISKNNRVIFLITFFSRSRMGTTESRLPLLKIGLDASIEFNTIKHFVSGNQPAFRAVC